MTDEDDPLDGADVGETRTVRESKTFKGINYEPCAFFGSDRFGDARIVDVEVIEDDRDGYADDFCVTWEADLTKALPPRWDYARDPLTPEQERSARRHKWATRLISWGVGVSGLLASFWIGIHVSNTAMREMTVNGEPVPVVDVLPVVILVFGIAALIMWGIRGGFLGRVTA